ncbi:hypothetical protein FDP41_002771 [Naegleria fowleri]|uniref:Uncharacterized protein n=1 Tax=Naegleria fowleri TaxID=5763 RepID=A0A6A5BST1_NAEFO|nr:uncharacterized protein FDP41_002771 [Naegleria fowleri]KAF0978256.1 hypothetical protein FDP41_002771 [Naegleria fowleri]CAG4713225.1 unnamed protein product [Naegleria fowleri]
MQADDDWNDPLFPASQGGEDETPSRTLMYIEGRNGFTRIFASSPTRSTAREQSSIKIPSLRAQLNAPMDDAERPSEELAINHSPGHFSLIRDQKQLSPFSGDSSSSITRKSRRSLPYSNLSSPRPSMNSTSPKTNNIKEDLHSSSFTTLEKGAKNTTASILQNPLFYNNPNTNEMKLRGTPTSRESDLFVKPSSSSPIGLYFGNTKLVEDNDADDFRIDKGLKEKTLSPSGAVLVTAKEIDISPKSEREDLIKQMLAGDRPKEQSKQNSYFTEDFISTSHHTSPKSKKTSIIFNSREQDDSTDIEDKEIVNILSQIKKSKRQALNEHFFTVKKKTEITPPAKESSQEIVDVNLLKQKEFSKKTLIDEIQKKNKEILDLRNKIIKLHSLNTSLESDIKSMEEANESIQFLSRSKDTTINELKKQIDELQIKLETNSQSHVNIVEGLQKTIENLNMTIKEKDLQIKDQDRQHLRPIIEEHNRTIRDLKSDIERERMHYEEKKARLLELIACKEDEIRKNGEKDKVINELNASIEKKDQEIRTLKLFNDNNMLEIERLKKHTQHLLEERREFTEQVKDEITIQIKEGQTKDERIMFLEGLVEKHKIKLATVLEEHEDRKQDLIRIIEEERRISNSLRSENFRLKNNEKAFHQMEFIRRNILITIKDVNHLLSLVETDGMDLSSPKVHQELQNDGDLLALSSQLNQRIDILKNRLTEKYAGQLGDCLTQ